MSGGGGHGSKNVVHKPVRTGADRRGVNPGWVAQKGQMVGNKATHTGGTTGYSGEKKFDGTTGISVPLGNSVAASTKCGVGGSRTLYGQSGSQGQHGAPNPGMPRPQGRGILTNE